MIKNATSDLLPSKAVVQKFLCKIAVHAKSLSLFSAGNFSHSFRAVILENVNSCFLALAFCLFKSIQGLLLSLKLSLFYFTFNGLFIFLIFFGFPISVPSVLPFSFDFSLY